MNEDIKSAKIAMLEAALKDTAKAAKKAAKKAKITPPRPEWMDSRMAFSYFGLSRSVLYRLYKSGQIKTTSIKGRGQIKGKRMFFSDSIAALFEANAEGGIEA